MAARHYEVCCENIVFLYFLAWRGLSKEDVQVVRVTEFQEIRPGAGFISSNFVIDKLGMLP